MKKITVDDIKTIIEKSANKPKTRFCSEWTRTLNKSFIQFAHENNLSIYCKTKGADWGEWLYDLTICNQNKESPYIYSTFLVLESEWKTDWQSIMEDFQKLLLCNSEFKVMVFYKKQEIIKDLREQIRLYTNTNGKFILACYTDENGYIFEVV